MNKFFKKLFFYLLIFNIGCLIAPISLYATAPDELRNAIDQKAQQLQDISNQIKENQANLETVQGQGKTLQNQIKQTDYNINQLNLNISSSQINIDKLALEINSLQYNITDTESEIALKQDAIIKIIQELQTTDNENTLLIFLKNKSLADSVFEAQNLADLNNGLRTEINNLMTLKQTMADDLNQTTNKKQATEIETENLKNRKLILADVKKEKNDLLAQTKNQEKIYQQKISDLQKQQMQIADEIDQLEQTLRASFDPSVLPIKRPGVLAYPVSDPYITQDYGNTSFASWAYKSGFHNGLDLRASLGTPVMAADDGEVMAVGNNGRVQYGKFILIKHNDNLATLYGHLSRQIVQKGQQVKRGQIIGYSGNTGYAYGPHLHFGVYWEPSVSLKSIPGAGLVPVGVTINPTDYL